MQPSLCLQISFLLLWRIQSIEILAIFALWAGGRILESIVRAKNSPFFIEAFSFLGTGRQNNNKSI
jgi:hypothetical protein